MDQHTILSMIKKYKKIKVFICLTLVCWRPRQRLYWPSPIPTLDSTCKTGSVRLPVCLWQLHLAKQKKNLETLIVVLVSYEMYREKYNLNHSTEIVTEFFSTLERAGMPQHILELKIGAPVLCLWKFTPTILCAGNAFLSWSAFTLSSHTSGKIKFIPRIRPA